MREKKTERENSTGGRFQLKRGRALEADDDRHDEWESRKQRETEIIYRDSYIAIECGLAVSGTYQAGTLLAYLPWRTKERSRNEAKHRSFVVVIVVVVLGCLMLRNQIACVGRFADVTT